jgi:hypothetical protein
MEFVSDLVRKLKPYFAEMLDGLITGAVKFALLRVNGDVVLEGSTKKIIGVFYGLPISSRHLFQSSASGVTSLGVIPAGAGVSSNLRLMNLPDADNATAVRIEANSTETHVDTITSGASVLVPFKLKMATVSKIELATDGNINLSPVSRVFLKNCTSAPSDTPVGGGYWFAQDGGGFGGDGGR